jgi:hypothetical protein
MMFIIRFQIMKGKEELWNYIVDNVKRWKTRSITPLYITERALPDEGVSLILDAKDPSSLANFLLKNFAKLDNVINITTVSLMKPRFFPVPEDTPKLQRYTISVTCQSKDCATIYENLSNLVPTSENVITYTALTFLEEGKYIIISVLSRDQATLDSFISKDLRSIKGIEEAEVIPLLKTQKLTALKDMKGIDKAPTFWDYIESEDFEDDVLKEVNMGC